MTHQPAATARRLSPSRSAAKGRVLRASHGPFRGPTFRVRRRAFLLTDTLVGLTIAAVIAAALAVALHTFRTHDRTLADLRAATRLAEQTLTNLQAERTRPAPPPHTTIDLQRLQTGDRIPGQTWLKVSVTRSQRTVSLTGAVPTAALPPKP